MASELGAPARAHTAAPESTTLWDTIRGHAVGDGRGTDGNERLTALTASVLFVLLAAEGVTILRMSTLLTAHVFIGMVLIPPLLLKLSSTGYRFVRYYSGDRAYRAAGPPVTPLRILAPVLVLLTVVLFASGIALVETGSRHGSTLFQIHKFSFILWIVVAAIHILYYLARVPRIVGAEVRGEPRRKLGRSVAHRGLRFAALSGALVVGVGLGLLFIPAAHSWEQGRHPRGTAQASRAAVPGGHRRAGAPLASEPA